MSYEISTENAAFIDEQVAKGVLHDPNEGLNKAIGLLRKQASLIDRLEQACQQIDNGRYIELDEAGLDEYFRGLEAIASGQ
ncbi:MAG: hypothetical protein WD851_10670 [Pirellulales bacterium]